MFDFTATDFSTSTRHTVLSVTGGGMLGVIPAAMLARYEELGQEAYGSEYRLCDSFDLVGGTSTGAVIATAIALGCSASEIADFYLKDAPKVMKRRWNAIPFLHDLYKGDEMTSHFTARTQGACLSRADLRCDLAITVKDMTNARPVLFSSLKASPARIFGVDIRSDELPLDLLMRASTAAPFLFAPVEIGGVTAVDGGMSPFGNPALLLAELAQAGLGGHVSLTSLGTGEGRARYDRRALQSQPAILRAIRALLSTLKDAEELTDEILRARAADGLITYQTYDLSLDRDSFKALGFEVSKREMTDIRKFGDSVGKEVLFEAARVHAARTICEPLPLVKAITYAAAI